MIRVLFIAPSRSRCATSGLTSFTPKKNRIACPHYKLPWPGALAFLYVWRGWWRLGEQGLLMVIINRYNQFMSYAKLGELLRIERGPGQWTEADRELLLRFDSDSHYDEPTV